VTQVAAVGPYAGTVTEPPALPRRFASTPLMLVVGSAVWGVVTVVLLVAYAVGGRALDIWFVTSIVGWLLGLVGYGIFRWQRAASTRGSRGAQSGLGG